MAASGTAARRLRAALRALGTAWRQIVGAPDYERYAAHMRIAHPSEPLLSPAEFAHRRLAERHERPGSRCC